VLQTLVNRIDLGMGLRRAVAAPRATQQNSTDVTAEQHFVNRYGGPLGALGHTFVVGEPGTSEAEIGALTAIEFRGGNRLVAAAEPTRRGGGSALVVHER
jgi:gamma-glutamyltranspeptidase/glutathione hydrolase